MLGHVWHERQPAGGGESGGKADGKSSPSCRNPEEPLSNDRAGPLRRRERRRGDVILELSADTWAAIQ